MPAAAGPQQQQQGKQRVRAKKSRAKSAAQMLACVQAKKAKSKARTQRMFGRLRTPAHFRAAGPCMDAAQSQNTLAPAQIPNTSSKP